MRWTFESAIRSLSANGIFVNKDSKLIFTPRTKEGISQGPGQKLWGAIDYLKRWYDFSVA